MRLQMVPCLFKDITHQLSGEQFLTNNLKMIHQVPVEGHTKLSLIIPLFSLFQIRLDASKILMPELPTASPEPFGTPRRRENLGKVSEVYQLCICGNGKLFLAPSDGQCSVELDNLVCL